MVFYDETYIFVIIGALLCLWASWKVDATFKKYSRMRSSRNITGEQAARMILDGAGIYDVRVEHISGNLTDHYSPKEKVLRLSDSVYNKTSVAAIGVAAHECGHAIQHQKEYGPIKLRTAIVPFANIGSRLSWPLIVIGLFLSWAGMFMLGIVLFSLVVLFQIVTLPVEVNASGRAIKILGDRGILQGNEMKGAKKVLNAAALTYFAATASSILQLLRLVILFGKRRD